MRAPPGCSGTRCADSRPAPRSAPTTPCGSPFTDERRASTSRLQQPSASTRRRGHSGFRAGNRPVSQFRKFRLLVRAAATCWVLPAEHTCLSSHRIHFCLRILARSSSANYASPLVGSLPLDPSTLEALPDGVLVADADGQVEALNTAGARILRSRAEEAVGRDWREVLPLVDAQGRDWWACTRPYDGLPSRTRQPERELTLPDGRPLVVTASYLREQPRGPLAHLVVSFRDMTSRARQERDNAELVATVAHELRSPLTSVKGFTATLLSKWERFNDEQKRLMLETVNSDADRVTRLIGELLDVSRIDAGRLELRKQVVDVPAAVRRCVAGIVASGEPPGRFVVEENGQLPEMWADPDKLDQVIGNIVENAVRHGDGTVTITVGPRAGGAEITVEDEGTGIAPEAEQRVFAKFWRGATRGGTGLGLFIAHGIIQAHGGTMTASRGPGGGARVRFYLPEGVPSFAS